MSDIGGASTPTLAMPVLPCECVAVRVRLMDATGTEAAAECKSHGEWYSGVGVPMLG